VWPTRSPSSLVLSLALVPIGLVSATPSSSPPSSTSLFGRPAVPILLSARPTARAPFPTSPVLPYHASGSALTLITPPYHCTTDEPHTHQAPPDAFRLSQGVGRSLGPAPHARFTMMDLCLCSRVGTPLMPVVMNGSSLSGRQSLTS
jgi:hypothetical protein